MNHDSINAEVARGSVISHRSQRRSVAKEQTEKLVDKTYVQPDSTSMSQYGQEKYRIIILIAYLLASSNTGILIITTAPIATQLIQIYGSSSSVLNLFTSSFMFSSFIFNFPASYLIGQVSIKYSIWIGIFTTVLGSWIRTLVNYSFYAALGGQLIAAVSSSFFFNAPSQLAARWFFPKNRAIATTIMVLTLPVFSAIGGYIPVIAVNKQKETIVKYGLQQQFKTRVYDLFFWEAVYCSITGFLGLMFFREAPKKPPSPSARVQRSSFCSSFRDIFRSRSFILIALSTGLSIGVFNTFQTILQQIFEGRGVTSQDAGLFNALNSPVSPISALLFGFWAAKIKRFKIFLVILTLCNLIVNAVLIPLAQLDSVYIVGTIQLLSCAFIAPGPALSMELAAEITFPISEAFTAGLIVVVDKLTSFIFTTIAGPMTDHDLFYPILYMLAGLLLIAFILMLFVEEKFIRRQVDKDYDPNDKPQNERRDTRQIDQTNANQILSQYK